MTAATFIESREEFSGSTNIQGLKYYLHEDLQGTEPVVETLSPPPPGMLATYRAAERANNSTDLRALGEEACKVIDASIPHTGAVLLRGIPARTAEEFASFWQGWKHAGGDEWEEFEYVNFGQPRRKEAGVDTATNIPNELALNLHNENSYNPIRPSRVGLYCIQQSRTGGESTIARNEDVTKLVPDELMEHVRDHGGIMYERSYRDASADDDSTVSGDSLSKQLAVSWQEKCGAKTRKEAEDFWVKYGFQKDHLLWEKDGTLRVQNVESGFSPDPQNPGKSFWFNNLDTVGVCADGSGRPPPDLLKEYQAKRWKAVYAFRLQPGDWLVLDNFRVQHGRLPYPVGETRRLLTVLTK